MMRIEIELSIPDDCDVLTVAEIVAATSRRRLETAGATIHRITVEQADA